MVEKRKPIPVTEAINRVMDKPVHEKTETIHISEAAGRRLAETITATHAVPPFDRSPYDGFAIRSVDSKDATRESPVKFQVTETIGAGSVASIPVGEFQAARIMTGAMLPAECDAVVMLELTKEEEPNVMSIKRSFNEGDNISFKGEDTEEGTVLVEKGRLINPGVTALLATFGYEEVKVAKKPVVGVLATGSELLEVNEPLEPGKIRNSNALMVAAQLERAGAEVNMLGKLTDDVDECFEAVRKAVQEVDILITTGGVSVGDFDFLPEVYARLKADVLFNKIAMRPGSVTTVAYAEDTYLFGLSGNPSACYVGFELLVRPVIQRMLMNPAPYLVHAKAVLGKDFTKPNPFARFVRSRLLFDGAMLQATPAGFNKSSAVTSLANTDCFVVLPGGTRGFEKGDLVDILLLEGNTEGSGNLWE